MRACVRVYVLEVFDLRGGLNTVHRYGRLKSIILDFAKRTNPDSQYKFVLTTQLIGPPGDTGVVDTCTLVTVSAQTDAADGR